MSIAKAVAAMDVSGIRKMFEQAATLKNPINLSIGQPDFDVPEPVKEQAIQHIRMGHNRYTPSPGIPELRDKIRTHLRKQGLDVEAIMITSGVSGGLLLSLMALLDPDDQVLIPDPYFVIYAALPPLLQARVKTLDTYPDFLLHPDQVQSEVTKDAKVLFLNNPSNPTGRVLPEERLGDIANTLSGSGLWVISDEIYDAFDYEGSHSYFGRFYEKTVTLGGFSKTGGMTGWRVGYAAGPKEIIEAMIKIQQYTFVCAPSPAQYASLTLLDQDMTAIRDAYRHKRDKVVETLSSAFEVVRPEGAFYCFLKHPTLSGADFVAKALEKEVLLIPGSIFSSKDSHFRLSFATSDTLLAEGLERMLSIA